MKLLTHGTYGTYVFSKKWSKSYQNRNVQTKIYFHSITVVSKHEQHAIPPTHSHPHPYLYTLKYTNEIQFYLLCGGGAHIQQNRTNSEEKRRGYDTVAVACIYSHSRNSIEFIYYIVYTLLLMLYTQNIHTHMSTVKIYMFIFSGWGTHIHLLESSLAFTIKQPTRHAYVLHTEIYSHIRIVPSSIPRVSSPSPQPTHQRYTLQQ